VRMLLLRAGRKIWAQVLGAQAGDQHAAILRVHDEGLVDCVPLSMPLRSVRMAFV
jgi:hypothetical protein